MAAPTELPHQDRLRRFSTDGNQNSFGVVFYNNNYALHRTPDIVPNVFRVPQVSAETGTIYYYSQIKQTIFPVSARPSISMIFTANTDVFTGDPRLFGMVNDIHKIDYPTLKKYQTSGDAAAWAKIADRLIHPVVSYSANTATSSTEISSAFTYVMLPEQFVKPDGDFTESLFEDKAQYFMNNRFMFTNTATTFINTVVLDSQGNIIPTPTIYSSTTVVKTSGPTSTITQGPWSGLTARGMFFTCFQEPSQPELEFPYPATSSTEADTFTPTFNFSSVEDGDEFILEVTYDVFDTGFTNYMSSTGVTKYRETRTDGSAEQKVNKTSNVPVGDDATLTRRTRRMNKPLLPGREYLYRVGNSKSIINLFGIRNEIISYSRYLSGITSNTQILNLVVDSKTVSSPATGETYTPPPIRSEAVIVK